MSIPAFDPDPALPAPSPLPPPLPVPSPSPEPTRRRGRLGWSGHLFFLTAWLLPSIVAAYLRSGSGHKHHPLGSVRAVLWTVALGAPFLGAFCGAAWLCSRATAAEWRLRWRGGVGPLWRGILYSVGIRITLAVVTVAVVLVLIAFHVIDPHAMERFRPEVENAIVPSVLAQDRAFFWCVVTLLSGFAGVSEEIWRGGMLAGLAGVFPRRFGGRFGQWGAVVPVALLFGLGHLYMGWPAVAAATVLGLALGAITVWHRTIWDAAIAHALFDAGSFAALAWTYQRHPELFGQ